MSSFSGLFGPGRRPRLGENNMRYLRFLSRLWKYSRVESFNTIAEPTRRAGRMNRHTQTVDDYDPQRAAWAHVCVRDLRSAADGGPARIRQPHCGARPASPVAPQCRSNERIG